MGRRLESVSIPADIWFNEELSLEERAVLAEIDRRNNAKNHANFAWLNTNNSLSFFAKISERKIVQILAKLESLNYIVINNKGNRGRVITITTHKTTHETTQNLRGFDEEIKKRKKVTKKEKKVSKKEIKKEINNIAQAHVRESYNDIFDGFGVFGCYREALMDFIRHLKINGNTMINSRLERLIVRLDREYGNDDSAKAVEISEAIASGYKRLSCEYEA